LPENENAVKTTALIEEAIKQYDISMGSTEELKFLDEISPHFSKLYSERLISVELFLLLVRKDYFGDILIQNFTQNKFGAYANTAEIRNKWFQIALGRPGKQPKETVQEFIHDNNSYRRSLIEVEFGEDSPNIVTLIKSNREIQLSTLLKAFRSDLPSFQKN